MFEPHRFNRVSVCRNSVRLVIRKVQYAPEKPGPQPMVETTRSFLMSDRSLHLEASLDKEVNTHATHTNRCLVNVYSSTKEKGKYRSKETFNCQVHVTLMASVNILVYIIRCHVFRLSAHLSVAEDEEV